MKILVKTVLIRALGSRFLSQRKLSAIRSNAALTILNLHRVCERNISAYDALQPRLFDGLLDWVKQRFQVITFRELAQFQFAGKPPLILSFDDGYLDFYEVVMPILDKHGLKANQNVVPGCIHSGKPPVNVLLQDFIGQAPEKLLRELKLPDGMALSDSSNRMLIGLKASAVLKKLPISEQQIFIQGCQTYFDRMDNFHTTPMMNLEQVIECSKQHEIGVHSWDHASMSSESDDYVKDDAKRCRDWLGEFVTPTQNIYAFPNGMAREGQADMVRAAGFDHVLCVGEKFSLAERWKHDRFTFHAKNESECRFRAMGGTAWPNRSR